MCQVGSRGWVGRLLHPLESHQGPHSEAKKAYAHNAWNASLFALFRGGMLPHPLSSRWKKK